MAVARPRWPINNNTWRAMVPNFLEAFAILALPALWALHYRGCRCDTECLATVECIKSKVCLNRVLSVLFCVS